MGKPTTRVGAWKSKACVPEKNTCHSEGNWVLGGNFARILRHQAVTEGPCLQIYNTSLEEELNHFEDLAECVSLYRGQGAVGGGDGEDEGSGKLVGKFKAVWGGMGDQGAQMGMQEEVSLIVFFLPPTPIPPRAPSSFTQNQRQCPS